MNPLFELEKGRIPEAEFVAMLEAELPDGQRLEGLRDSYFRHLHPNPEMIEFMRTLRERGLRMALLTNNVREWEPQWRAMLPDIDRIFELVVDSAFVGMRKPEPEIYDLTVQRLGEGLTAAECMLVDDIEVNCTAAAELGMHAVRFVDSAQAIADVESAIAGG